MTYSWSLLSIKKFEKVVPTLLFSHKGSTGFWLNGILSQLASVTCVYMTYMLICRCRCRLMSLLYWHQHWGFHKQWSHTKTNLASKITWNLLFFMNIICVLPLLKYLTKYELRKQLAETLILSKLVYVDLVF